MNSALALIAGALLAAGLVCLVAALVRTAPRLDLALDQLAASAASSHEVDAGPLRGPSDRLGAYLYRRLPLALTEGQRRALQLQQKSIAEFYADKAVMAIIGVLLPGVVLFGIAYAAGAVSPWPAAVPLVGGIVGFFVPDLLLRRSATVSQTGAAEALLVFIDLVTLERLANASATQALHNAAALSEVPLFVQIRIALERARLEQQSPYAELRRLAEQLRLPQLADVADVMQLDESGAALSGALRARVRELRDAHLTEEQIKASAAAEGMTIYMTLPALIFGLIFLTAAMLKIVLA